MKEGLSINALNPIKAVNWQFKEKHQGNCSEEIQRRVDFFALGHFLFEKTIFWNLCASKSQNYLKKEMTELIIGNQHHVATI